MRGLTSAVAGRWDCAVDPRPLAVARIGVGLAAFLIFIESYGRLSSVADGDLPLPAVGFLPAVTSGGAVVFLVTGLVAATALATGVGVRLAAPAVTALGWFGFVWEQQTYSNHMMLTAWLALWLALTPCDAAWSVASRLGRRRVVRWGDQFLLMTQVSVCYLFAALVKISPRFLSGEALRDFVELDVDLPDRLWLVMSVLTVATELGLAVGLWLRRAKWVVAPAGLMLHLSIPVAMPSQALPLLAFSALCLTQYPLFLAAPPDRPVRQGSASQSLGGSSSSQDEDSFTTRQPASSRRA